MRCSAKIAYSCKAMMELARQYGSHQSVSLHEISEKQGMSSKFLLQLMLRLKSASLVESQRGVSGGYMLSRAPSAILLADIIRAVDDSVLGRGLNQMTDATKTDKILESVWEKGNECLDEYFSSITLQEMADRVMDPQGFMYQI